MNKTCRFCGAKIKEGSSCCPNCNSGIPNQSPSGYGKDKHKQKFRGLLFLCVLLAVFLLLGGIIFVRSKMKMIPEKPIIQFSASMPQILLLIDETDFITGSESYAEVTVHYDDTVQGDIEIRNDLGSTLCTIPNDGSGSGQTSLPINTDADGVILLSAVCNAAASNTVACYVHPEITQEMVNRLIAVSGDMADFIDGQNFEEPFGPEALKAVADYLRNDSRVSSVEQGAHSVLYFTTDNLAGSYSMFDSSEEGLLASAGETVSDTVANQSPTPAMGIIARPYDDSRETFVAFLRGASTQAAILDSEKSLTNNHVIALQPISNDTALENAIGMEQIELPALAAAMDGTYQEVLDGDVYDFMESGAFTDCGFLLLQSHGMYDQGQFWFRLKEMTLDEFKASESFHLFKKTWLQSYYDQVSSHSNLLRLTFNYGGEGAHFLLGSTSFIGDCLRNSLFDNTIFFNGSCYGHEDPALRTLLFNHGLKAYVSTDGSFKVGAIIDQIHRLCTALKNGDSIDTCASRGAPTDLDMTDSYLCFLEYLCEAEHLSREEIEESGRYVVLEYSNDNGTVHVTLDRDSVSESSLEHFNTAAAYHADAAHQIHYNTSADGRTVLGRGSLTGEVILSDISPASGATVRFYRWLNHQFTEVPELKRITGQDGTYHIEELMCGIYGITAELTLPGGLTVTDSTVCEVTEPDCHPEDLVLQYYTVIGTILDQDTLQPIADANVWLIDAQTIPSSVIFETATAANGEFEVGCTFHNYSLRCTAPGYTEATLNNICAGLGKDVVYRLPEPILLQRVLVTSVYSATYPGTAHLPTITADIPAINLDTPEAIAINKTIYDALYPYASMKVNNIGVKYRWEVIGNVLSLTTVIQIDYWTKHTKSYTLVLNDESESSESLTDLQKLLSAVNMTEEEFYDELRKTATEIFDSRSFLSAKDAYSPKSSQSAWEKARIKTFSDENLKRIAVSFHNGDLLVRLTFYYPDPTGLNPLSYAFPVRVR